MSNPADKQLTPDVVISSVVDDIQKPEVKDQSGEQVQVEIQDDTPPEDQGRRRREEGQKPYDVSDDEIARYDDSVQGRIKKLRFEYHEERRLKEEAGRREQAAIQYAKRLIAENQRLSETLGRGEKTLIEQAQQRAMAQIDAATRALQEAHAAGDAEKIAKATQVLSQHSAELEQYKSYQPQYQERPQPQVREQELAQQVQAAQPRVSPMAMEWAKRNSWFNQDEAMTLFARGLDDALIKGGANPNSPEYWNFLDAKIRDNFPERFSADGTYQGGGNKPGTQQQRQAQPQQKTVVAPATRSAPGGTGTPKKITLSKSQADVARRLGIPVEAYAAQLLKEMEAQNG